MSSRHKLSYCRAKMILPIVTRRSRRISSIFIARSEEDGRSQMSPLVQMARRDRRLKRDNGPVESRLRSRLGSRMIPNDVAVCLLPISFGGGAGGRAVVVCCNSLLGEPG